MRTISVLVLEVYLDGCFDCCDCLKGPAYSGLIFSLFIIE